MSEKSIIIIGGGIAGLSAGWLNEKITELKVSWLYNQ
jgi:protoporphyrinogen oxidase